MAVVAIDWDGTLVDSSRYGYDPILLPGAKEAISLFREKGHKVVIFTANNPAYVAKWLAEWGIPTDGVWNEDMVAKTGKYKLNADIFIDDKGYHKPFNSDWTTHTQAVLTDPRIEGKDNRRW